MATTKRRVSVLKQIKAIADTNLRFFLQAYLVAALWSDSENERNTWELNWIEQPTFDSQREQCEQFLVKCYDLGLLPKEENAGLMEQAGHDFALTRNGHGTGFWDRDEDVYGEGNGDKLAALCGWKGIFDEFQVEHYRRKISFSPLYNQNTQLDKWREKYEPQRYKQEAKDVLGDQFREDLSPYEDNGDLKPGYMQGRGAA